MAAKKETQTTTAKKPAAKKTAKKASAGQKFEIHYYRSSIGFSVDAEARPSRASDLAS